MPTSVRNAEVQSLARAIEAISNSARLLQQQLAPLRSVARAGAPVAAAAPQRLRDMVKLTQACEARLDWVQQPFVGTQSTEVLAALQQLVRSETALGTTLQAKQALLRDFGVQQAALAALKALERSSARMLEALAALLPDGLEQCKQADVTLEAVHVALRVAFASSG